MTTPQFLVIGQVLRPHGVRGELRIQISTSYPERFKHTDRVGLTADPEAQNSQNIHWYDVERGRLHQQFAILKLADVEDRETADTLRGQSVVVPIEDAVGLEEGEYYFHQLIGLQMLTDSGRLVGVVSEILETGANEVYVVQSAEYGEILIPAIASVIQEIDLPSQKIIITPIPGLLPEDS